ncbi:sensor histidine kinase [Nonomuraea sp. NPDC050328]|uniref:sensor histidine kinase n=1 Tax=Nonomuraea sp. NPDC050328 TaxID=3364361 RepID=UPI0037AD261E
MSAWLEPPDGRPYHALDLRRLSPFCLMVAGPVWSTVEGHYRPVWLAWTVAVLAAGLFVAVVLLAARGRGRAAWLPLAALGALSAAACLGWGADWFYLFPLVGLGCGAALTGRAVPRVLLACTALVALLSWRDGAGIGEIMAFAWGTFGAGAVLAAFLHLHALIGELARTREKLARAAVAEERLRFSRDLHDLLGHTLSVMVVKAEAVRRLAPRDPEAAAGQAGDIEVLGREALTQVRAAVTGYRGRGLAAELDSARVALADAGVALAVEVAEVRLAPETDALYGWAVREGTTNVIRHSRASTCEISLAAGEDGTVLEIRDDGSAQTAPAGGAHGHGLRGLDERVAAAGGTMSAGPRPGGGFVLRIELP